MGVRYHRQRELHGDTSRGANAALRIVINANTVAIADLGELSGAWVVGDTEEPGGGHWALTLERDGVAALLSFDMRERVATLTLDSGTHVLPYIAAPVPAWLVGRWTVNRDLLDAERRERLGAGMIFVDFDSLGYHGFAADAQIYPASWSGAEVRTTENGLVRLDFRDYDEAWLEVRERDGDRLVVYLGGMDALPWGEEMPVVRVEK